MNNLIEKAARIALIAHNGQTRKGSDAPYAVHPVVVAIKLARHGFRDEVIAAALVHDVLEDTDFPKEEMQKELGDEVLELVLTLSEPPKQLPWEERKGLYIKNICESSDEVKAISIADKINNLEGFITGLEQEGTKIFEDFTRGPEKQVWFFDTMLHCIKQSWDHPLINEYEELFEKFKSLV